MHWDWHEAYRTLTSERTELEFGFLLILYFLATTLKKLEDIHDRLRERLPAPPTKSMWDQIDEEEP